MSGRYLAMGVSQQLAAPTYPKINEYNKWEQEKELEREASDTRTNWGEGEEGVVTPPWWQTDTWVLLLNSSHQ